MTAESQMYQIDRLLSHVWMVRTFLKHSEEAEEDDELCGVHRGLYDYMLALGGALRARDSELYLRQARKKLPKLRRAVALYVEIQPEISGHTNFVMAAQSLTSAVDEITALLEATEHP
ncbi:MAG: amidohydrolase [Planctomycetaceae bacterium]|nr:amidohydrolase [Planctomycetaceae bacterium]